MNKYQEALDYFTIGRTFTEEETEDMYEMRYRLAELIDKLPYWLELEERDKPMKPTHIENNRYSCGNCCMSFTVPNVRFVNNQFCGVCGKRLDWSDEE